MEILIGIILTVIFLMVAGYVFLVTTGYDNLKGINLQLDEMYSDTNEMACAVFAELKKQGRECEVVEMGKGYPQFLVDGKKYLMTYKMASISGLPVQTIQLKKITN